MASGSGSSFSKDQLALAKQLQSGYMTSGTFHSQGQGGPSKGAPSQQAPRKPAQPVRSQPPAPRSMNGLVRPLPSNAPATRPAAMNSAAAPKMQPAVRPAPAVQSAPGTRPAPPNPTMQSAARPAPAHAVPPSAHTTLPVARSVTQPAPGSAPPVQPMPSDNQTYTKPPPMPTNLQPAMTPTPLHPATRLAHAMSSSPAAAHRTLQEPHSSQLLKSAFNSLSLATPTASAGRENPFTQTKRRDDAVSKAVIQGIKINQMGKPIKWNWASEEPVARELTADEIEQMRQSSPLPPIIYDRPFHQNAIMKAPGLEGKDESLPRKPIGLKGSRHAQ